MAKAKETKAKSTETAASSWWKERSKIIAQKTESKPVKTKTKKAVRPKKAAKVEKGDIYHCEVCGCEIVCVSPGAEAVVCCDEPMSLVC